jgi:cytochrome oxidase assembly protein ShyY1
MGGNIVRRLLRAGHHCVAYDRDPAPGASLAAEGAVAVADLPAMVAALYPQGGAQVVPFYLEAERADVPGGWPRGGQTTLDIPNNHFQYALTWFLMAFCVAAIYAVWLRTRLRGEACDGGND